MKGGSSLTTCDVTPESKLLLPKITATTLCQSYWTCSNFSYPQSSHRQLLLSKNCETVAVIGWYISDISKICIFLNNTGNKSSSIIFIRFLLRVKCQKINQIPVNWCFVDLCMSWTSSVLQESETVCCAVIMSLTTSTIKIIVGIVGSVFITVVNWNAWIKRGKLLHYRLNLTSLSTARFILQGKILYKFRHFSPVFTICVTLTLYYDYF